jgi:hypothetical protein
MASGRIGASIFFCLFMGLWAQAAFAADPAAPSTQPVPAAAPGTQPAARIDGLLANLAHENFHLRQKAQDELARMGPPVRARLVEEMKRAADDEVRTRLEAAIRQIDEGRMTGASMITIHLKKASPGQVLSEICRQANAQIRLNPPNLWTTHEWTATDIDIEEQPFWAAMKSFCKTWNLAPVNNGMEREMVITEGTCTMFGKWSSVSGPFLVAATYIHTNNSRDLNQPANVTRNCNVQIMVCPEPKMRVLQGSYSANIEKVLDDKGNALNNANVGMPGMQPLQPGNSWMWNMSACLLPRAESRSIATLKGSARFMLQARSESGEIADILSAKNVSKSAGGRRFLVKEVRKNNEMFQVMMTIFRPGWTAQEWNFQFPGTLFKLVDGEGNALFRMHAAPGSMTNEQMELTIHYQRQNWNGGVPAGEPVKLTWEIPVESKEIQVPFELLDLPLP